MNIPLIARGARRRILLVLQHLMTVAAILLPASTQAQPLNGKTSPEMEQRVRSAFPDLGWSTGVSFTENRGQVIDTRGALRPDILYTASSGDIKLYLRTTGISYLFMKVEGERSILPARTQKSADAHSTVPERLDLCRMDMELVGANPAPEVVAEDRAPGIRNYYLPHAPKGILDVPSFKRLIYKGIYPGIDMVIRGGGGRDLKYEFVVAPGADPSAIRLRYVNAEGVALTGEDGLHVTNSLGSLEEGSPYTYQDLPEGSAPSSAGERVDCRFVVEGTDVRFAVGDYDHTRALVIDPVVEWANYLGGINGEIRGSEFDVSINKNNNEFGVIGTTLSPDFPATAGSFQLALKGVRDAFVAKMDPTPNMLWCTYMGGDGDEDAGGIVADQTGNFAFCGWTTSTNLPVLSPLKSASGGSEDFFIGSLENVRGGLQWLTYYGGDKDDEAYGIDIDQAGIIIVCGMTKSANMPLRAPLIPAPLSAVQGYVMKILPGGTGTTFSSYYGGTKEDWFTCVAADNTGGVVLGGIARSNNLVLPAGGAPFGGVQDGFMIRLSNLNQISWGTYYGGSDTDAVMGAAVDVNNNPVFCGYTRSANFPTTPGAFQPMPRGQYDMFAVQFTIGGVRNWATSYGGGMKGADGTKNDFGYEVVCTATGQVYMTGSTVCPDFPVTPRTYQPAINGPADAVVVRFDPNGQREWASYYGGADADYAYSITLTTNDEIIMGGSTSSADLPGRDHGLRQTLNGPDDGFVVKFHPPCWITGAPLETRIPEKVCIGSSFTLTARDGDVDYLWLPNGETTRSISVTASGTYSVVITDPEGCRDTGKAKLNFYPKPVPFIQGPREICAGDSVLFDASSTGGIVSYKWSNGATTSKIWVSQPGSYSVRITDTNGCESEPVTATLDIVARPDIPVINTGRPPGDTIWLCPGGTTTLVAPPGYYSYFWTTGATTQKVVVGGPGIYSLRVTNPTGCVAYSDKVVVMSYPKPQPTITALGPTTFCPGDSVTLVAADPLVRDDNFTWSNGMRGARITIGASGTYRVNGRTGDGCIGGSDQAITVTVRPRPGVSISGPESVCSDAISTYKSPSSPSVKYTWELFGNGTILGPTDGPSIRIKWGASGTGTITLKAIDMATGCTAESSRTVRLGTDLTPVIIVGGPTTFCRGDSVVLGAGSGYMTYLWSTGDTTEYITVHDTGTFTVKVVDSGNCQGTSAPVMIGIVDRPTPDITGPRKVCLGATASYSAANVPGDDYRWVVTGGVILGGDGTSSITVQWGSGGTGTVDMIETRGGICQEQAATRFVQIGTELEPEIAASGKLSFCVGDSIELDAGEGYDTYLWSTGASTRKIVVRQSGKYLVQVSDAGGCTGSSQPVTVTVSPLPTAIIAAGGPTSFCSGDSVTLDAGAGFATYKWTTGAATRTIVVKQSGSYGVTVANAAGCTAIAAPVAVNVEQRPAPSIGGPIKVCRNSTVNYSTLLVAGDKYVWTVNGGTIMSGDGTSSISVQWGSGPTGEIDLVETNASGRCAGVATRYTVSIGTVLEPVIIPSRSLDLCPGDSVELDAGTGFATYEWTTGATTQKITVSTPGSYGVKVADAGGCSGSSQPVTVVAHTAPVPVITPGGSTTIRSGDSVVLDAGAGYVLYDWSTGESTRTIVVRAAGSYSVTVIDAIGCRGVSPAVSVTVVDNPPPPLPVRASLGLPVVEAVPGERVVIPLTLKSIANLPATGSLGFTARLRFRASLLAPVGSTPPGSIDGTDRVIDITGSVNGGTTGGDITSLEFVALLADTVGTTLKIESFRWSDPASTATVDPGEFRLKGLCIVGPTRLVGSSAIAGLKQVRPNPAGSRAEIEYELSENGRTQIVITDMLGRIVGVVFDGDAQPGRYVATIDAGALPSGAYLVTLRTPTTSTTRSLTVRK